MLRVSNVEGSECFPPSYNDLYMKERTVVSVVTYVELSSIEIESGYA
jgi:hypothetical protein